MPARTSHGHTMAAAPRAGSSGCGRSDAAARASPGSLLIAAAPQRAFYCLLGSSLYRINPEAYQAQQVLVRLQTLVQHHCLLLEAFLPSPSPRRQESSLTFISLPVYSAGFPDTCSCF